MAKPRKPNKPDVLIVGRRVRARPIRGPRAGTDEWYWQARVHEDSTSRVVWSGWGTPEHAEKHLADLVRHDGLDKPEPVGDEAPPRTVRDLLETWATEQVARNPSSLGAAGKTGYVNRSRPVARLLGDRRLDRVDGPMLERYVADRLGEPVPRMQKIRATKPGEAPPAEPFPCPRKGWRYVATDRTTAPRTVAKELLMLRAAWAWAYEKGWTARRAPPKVIVTADEYAVNHETPTPEHVAAVYARLTGWRRLALHFLFATGGRVSELAELPWSRVDLDAGLVTLRGKRRKGKHKLRTVPLPVDLVDALREARGEAPETALVLGIGADQVRGRLGPVFLAKACKAAKVPRFTPHGLRRAAADAMLRAGVDVGTAAAFLGHSPAVMLRHYRTPTLDDKRLALARTRLGALPKGKVVAFPRTGNGDER